MTKIMIGYGTTEGQTARIAKRIAEVIRGQGVEVQALDLKRSSDVVLDDYDAVIVGGSIHMGKHEDHVANFVRRNRATLERLPSAFFSVSLAAHATWRTLRRTSRTFPSRQAGVRLRSDALAAPCSIASTGS
jgi:menaquinone-dependent protoporphyrinogen oxidase